MVHLPQTELCPVQRGWQQRRQTLADSACDDAVRRPCLMGRYFWVRGNSLELFNNAENDMNYHTQQSPVILEMKEL